MSKLKLLLGGLLLLASQYCVAASYTYDALNRLTRTIYNNGQSVDYAYDAGGNLLSVTSNTLTVPDPFVFTAQTGVPLNTLAVSNAISVTGINAAPSISITGGEYSVNGGAYTMLPGNVLNGNNVTVRLTSAGTYSTATTATLTIGGVSGTFTATTATPPPTAFTLTAKTGAALNSWISSNVVTIAGLPVATPSDISIAGGEYSINGGAYTAVAGTVINGQTVVVRVMSSSAYSTLTTTTLTIGTFSTNFNVTTLDKLAPDPFIFTAQSNMAPNSVVTSNTIQVTGITAPSPISIVGGAYSINGGAYTGAAGNVNNFDSVTVQLTAPASGTKQAVLTIGGVSGAFSVSTRSSVHDFNGDGKADILWRDQTTGQNVLWFMNGATLSSYAYTTSAATNWTPVGISDFNGDGKADILWRDQTTGKNVLWFMNGATLSSWAYTYPASSDWVVAGIGDFDGDGKKNDILWFNTVTRQTVVWITNNGQLSSYGYVSGAVAAGWNIAGVGDFDGDGKSDILWRNTNGTNVIWFMNGASMLRFAAIPSAASIWSIKGVADFDGDGKADIFWQDTSGNTYVWLMNGAAAKGYAPSYAVGTAAGWTPLEFADFNGDGKADILWRNAAGQTIVWLMNGLALPTYSYSTSAALNWTAIGK